jgi:dihydroorotate dehydrogenase (fumarate)
MDLSTKWLGLDLPHPFVAGASPLSDSVDRCRRLEDGGIAAIVLRSLFEEQIDQEALAHHQAEFGHADAHGEALTYLPRVDECVFGPDEYLAHLRAVKRAVAVPVIASLNGCSEGGWLDYARRIDEAGADALELNLYSVATDAGDSGADLEQRAIAIVRQVACAVRIPVAVKLSPFYTSLPHFALQLQDAGASGLVLFNRFFEPDVDVDAQELRPHLELSDSRELGLRLRWLALLSGQLRCGLAVSGGVHTPHDALKAVLCGAHAVQLVAALVRGGVRRIGELREGLAHWLEENGCSSLRQVRGSLDRSRSPDPKLLERVHYMHLLQTYRLDGGV